MNKKIVAIESALLLACLILLLPGASGAVQGTEVSLQSIEPFAYCSIEFNGPYTQLQQAIAQLAEEMRNQNVAPAAELMAIYYNNPANAEVKDLQWEVGFPITAQALIQPPLVKKEWNYTQVAVCLHQGAYEDTADTITKIIDWMKEKGYVPAGPIMERYLDMNPAELKPEQRKTEIWVPCKKQAG
jgi:effector-binding domain-containing protein